MKVIRSSVGGLYIWFHVGAVRGMAGRPSPAGGHAFPAGPSGRHQLQRGYHCLREVWGVAGCCDFASFVWKLCAGGWFRVFPMCRYTVRHGDRTRVATCIIRATCTYTGFSSLLQDGLSLRWRCTHP